MSRLMETLSERHNQVKVGVGTALVAVATPSIASADPVAYDLGDASAGVAGQITSVLTDVLPVAGGLIALAVGWKLLRRMVKSA